MRTEDLTHTSKDGTITVLRQYEGDKYVVCQGTSFYAGLSDNIKHFENDYNGTCDYFRSLTEGA